MEAMHQASHAVPTDNGHEHLCRRNHLLPLKDKLGRQVLLAQVCDGARGEKVMPCLHSAAPGTRVRRSVLMQGLQLSMAESCHARTWQAPMGVPETVCNSVLRAPPTCPHSLRVRTRGAPRGGCRGRRPR